MFGKDTLEIIKTSLRPNNNPGEGNVVKIYYQHKVCNLLLQCHYEPISDPSFTYTVKAIPFGLYRYNALGGGIVPINSRSCKVTDSIYSNEILSETVSTAKDTRTGQVVSVNGNAEIIHPNDEIPIGKPYNYVSDFVTVPSFTLEQYNGQYVKCIMDGTTRTYYGFSTITTPDGTYNVMDFNKVVGNPVCCERESTPSKTCQDGKWIAHEEAQCSLIKPCPGSVWNPDPNNNKQLVKYKCLDSKCVAEYKAVQCTSSSQCASNQICDANWNCVNAGTNPNPTPVNCSTCPECQGCSTQCQAKLGGLVPSNPVQIGSQECVSKFLFWCTKEVPVTTNTCSDDWTLVWIFGIVLTIVIVLVLVLVFKSKKGGTK
jgi:hypothetical protein